MSLIFECLSKQHDRISFDCEVPSLNCYIKNQASQDVKRGLAAVYVLADGVYIAGFYTLSQFAINPKILPINLSKKFPQNILVPCTLIGRLAVDKQCQKQGWGKMILFHAMQKIAKASKEIGSFAAVVDAKISEVKPFYLKYGFIEIPDSPLRLFLPVASIFVAVE